MNDNIQQLFEKDGVSKKTVLVAFEYQKKGIIREIKENISVRAFENLFFRQFYFLAKHKNYISFQENLDFLINNKIELIDLLKVYHYELIFRDYQEKETIFRKEIFQILTENNILLNNINIATAKSIKTIFNFNLFSINLGDKKQDFSLRTHIFTKDIDVSDSIGGITFSIYSGNNEVYAISVYLSHGEILISNIQKIGKDNSDYFLIKYYKILLYLVLEIGKISNIKNIKSFSNENHPCKYHKINNGFQGDYDNILKNIGMYYNIKDKYLYGDINQLKIKGINPYIRQNINHNIQNIITKLGI